MYCPSCHVLNPEGSTHCTHCGHPMNVAEGVPPTPQSDTYASPQTCGLAVAAMVCGILSFLCMPLLLPAAIICGIIALVKISKSQGQLTGNGLAITGIALPIVFGAVLVPIMLAILMPALAKAKDVAQRVVCETNMQGLSTAIVLYMNDYDDEYPTPEAWCDLLVQHADVSPKSFQCMTDAEGVFVDDGVYSYAMNANLGRLGEEKMNMTDAARTVLLFEADLGKNGVGGVDDMVYRHQSSSGQPACNVLFADGHVELVAQDQLHTLQW